MEYPIDFTRISPHKYADHGWPETNAPEYDTSARGEADTMEIVAAFAAPTNTK